MANTLSGGWFSRAWLPRYHYWSSGAKRSLCGIPVWGGDIAITTSIDPRLKRCKHCHQLLSEIKEEGGS